MFGGRPDNHVVQNEVGRKAFAHLPESLLEACAESADWPPSVLFGSPLYEPIPALDGVWVAASGLLGVEVALNHRASAFYR